MTVYVVAQPSFTDEARYRRRQGLGAGLSGEPLYQEISEDRHAGAKTTAVRVQGL